MIAKIFYVTSKNLIIYFIHFGCDLLGMFGDSKLAAWCQQCVVLVPPFPLQLATMIFRSMKSAIFMRSAPHKICISKRCNIKKFITPDIKTQKCYIQIGRARARVAQTVTRCMNKRTIKSRG